MQLIDVGRRSLQSIKFTQTFIVADFQTFHLGDGTFESLACMGGSWHMFFDVSRCEFEGSTPWLFLKRVIT